MEKIIVNKSITGGISTDIGDKVVNEDESPKKYGIFQGVVCRFFKKHKKLILGCLAILLLSFGFRQGDEWYRLISCFVGGAVIGLI